MVTEASDNQSSSPLDTVLIPWRNAPLTIELRRGKPTPGDDTAALLPPTIVIFENGLGSARASWADVLGRLPSRYTLLSYCRFGQGDTPPLPEDVPEELRDGAAAARDLYELIRAVEKREHIDLASADVVLVAHSIGAAIGRLLITNHDLGGAIKGVLLLDPSIVNSDFVSLYPEPRDDEPEELTRTREATRRVFHPSVPNRERFNRKTFATLLPFAEKPVLKGDPYLTVVAHDPAVAFGEAAEKVSFLLFLFCCLPQSMRSLLPALLRIERTSFRAAAYYSLLDGHKHKVRKTVY